MKSADFIEEIHFYYDSGRLMVLTEKYLLERGYCCGKGCRHCPYNYLEITDPIKRNTLRQKQIAQKNKL
ncbi:MAG: DUF5522 domain-containing protein [Ginsengibacter sp.]